MNYYHLEYSTDGLFDDLDIEAHVSTFAMSVSVYFAFATILSLSLKKKMRAL